MNNDILNWMELPLSKLLIKYDSGDWGNKPENQDEGTITIRSTDFDDLGGVVYDKSVRRVFKKDIIQKKQLLRGDILLNKSSGSNYHIGKVIFFNTNKKEQHHFSNFIQRLRVNSNTIMNKYLYYYLSSIYGQNVMKKYIQTASGLKNINMKSYYRQKIPVPPLIEQHGIVEVLKKVDECIRLTAVVIDRAKELKRGLMQQLLTRGIGHTEYKETQLGVIPDTWRISKLGKVLIMCEYGLSYPMFYEGKYPIFRMNNFDNGIINDKDIKYLDLDIEEFQKFKLDKGDILFNRTNSYDLVGKVGIFLLEGDYTFASYLIRIRTQEDLNPKYLNYFLNLGQTQNKLRQLATRGVSQSNINAQSLKSIIVPVPPVNEQNKLVEIIDNQHDLLKLEKQKKLWFSLIKQGLMQILLSGKKRVELRVNGLHRIGNS